MSQCFKSVCVESNRAKLKERFWKQSNLDTRIGHSLIGHWACAARWTMESCQTTLCLHRFFFFCQFYLLPCQKKVSAKVFLVGMCRCVRCCVRVPQPVKQFLTFQKRFLDSVTSALCTNYWRVMRHVWRLYTLWLPGCLQEHLRQPC